MGFAALLANCSSGITFQTGRGSAHMTEERRKPIPQRFVSWVDRRHLISIRGLTMYVTLALTSYATVEAFRFAYFTKLPGIEVAAILAAIMAPLAALQKYAFDTYMKSKDGTP